MNTLVLPVSTLSRLMRQLIDDPARRCFLNAGIRETAGHRDWLARDIIFDQPRFPDRAFEVRANESPPGLLLPSTADVVPASAGLILLGTGRHVGQIAITAIDAGRPAPITRLSLTGPGMRTFDLRSSAERERSGPEDAIAVSASERWSRTIGALGGDDIWRRLVGLKMTVIGAGRGGSLMARTLVSVGARDLTIIDPDVVERHNLGESDAMNDRDVGHPKAIAVARHLRPMATANNGAVRAVTTSVWDRRGLDAAKASDVIFCCVDRDGPRLVATLIAAAHHRVIVDLGTAIVPADSGDGTSALERSAPARRLGADIRLILPGDGCLLCRGGLTDYHGALRELTTPSAASPSDSLQRHEFGARAGSLRSLNLLAVGTALRLFEAVVTGHGRGGWLRIEDDGSGRIAVSQLESNRDERDERAPPTCAVCLRAGMGDDAI